MVVEQWIANYWWLILIIHILCCGIGYGIFHNVKTDSFIAIDRLFLIFGIISMLALILEIIFRLVWEIIKLPYYLGVFIRDKIGFELKE